MTGAPHRMLELLGVLTGTETMEIDRDQAWRELAREGALWQGCVESIATGGQTMSEELEQGWQCLTNPDASGDVPTCLEYLRYLHPHPGEGTDDGLFAAVQGHLASAGCALSLRTGNVEAFGRWLSRAVGSWVDWSRGSSGWLPGVGETIDWPADADRRCGRSFLMDRFQALGGAGAGAGAAGEMTLALWDEASGNSSDKARHDLAWRPAKPIATNDRGLPRWRRARFPLRHANGVSIVVASVALLDRGSGDCYPLPQVLSLLPMDNAFREAATDALACAIEETGEDIPEGKDLCWWLTELGNPYAIRGRSAGLAMAVLLHQLLKDAYIGPETVLSGVLRRTDGTYQLERAGDPKGKTSKAIGEGVSLVILPEANRGDLVQVAPGSANISFAADVSSAAQYAACEQLADDIYTSDDVMGDHTDLQPRTSAESWIDAAISDTSTARGGFLVIQGGPGTGKTALVTRCVRRLAARGDTPVRYFLKRDRAESIKPDVFRRSIMAQLRRKHGMPESKATKEKDDTGRFEDAMKEASARLNRLDRQEIVFIDGLDEACGPRGEPAKEKPEKEEPEKEEPEKEDPGILDIMGEMRRPGILVLVTSRPPEGILASIGPDILKRYRLGSEEGASDDIIAYFGRRNTEEDLGMSEEDIRYIAARVDGNFLLAERGCDELRELRLGMDTESMEDPGHAVWDRAFSKSIDDRVGQDWDHIWRHAKCAKEEAARALGVIALAADPLSRDSLRSFGLWDTCVSVLVDSAEDWFRPRLNDSKDPIQFCHAEFRDFILDRVDVECKKEIHACYAEACADGSYESSEARDYVLRYRLHHLTEARQFEEVGKACFDLDYLVSDASSAPLVYRTLSSVSRGRFDKDRGVGSRS